MPAQGSGAFRGYKRGLPTPSGRDFGPTVFSPGNPFGTLDSQNYEIINMWGFFKATQRGVIFMATILDRGADGLLETWTDGRVLSETNRRSQREAPAAGVPVSASRRTPPVCLNIELQHGVRGNAGARQVMSRSPVSAFAVVPVFTTAATPTLPIRWGKRAGEARGWAGGPWAEPHRPLPEVSCHSCLSPVGPDRELWQRWARAVHGYPRPSPSDPPRGCFRERPRFSRGSVFGKSV